MKIEIICLLFCLTLGNGLSLSIEGVKTKEDVQNIVKLRDERKSEGELGVDFDRFSGGICLLDQHCAFLVVFNNTLQISYCDTSQGK